MAGWTLLLAIVLFGQCVQIVDGHNCCTPETKKFLVPRGILKGLQPNRLYYGSPPPPPPDSGGCTSETCGKAEPAPPPPPPSGTCPGPSICPGPEACGGLQGSESGDSKPNRPGLVDFETLLKDYAFYDEVDKRILTYNGDKKTVRFAPGTKKDPSEPIYTHDLKSVIDYEQREDDCSESFWGCLIGDLVADVLSESSNETKELVGEVIQTLELAQDIGHAVLDHLEGHPDKQEGQATEDESFDARRKRKKTNYPFLPPVTEETCPGCAMTGGSSETQSASDAAPDHEAGEDIQSFQEAEAEPEAEHEPDAEHEPEAEPEHVAEAGGAGGGGGGAGGGGCDCEAFVSKSCSLPAERSLVSAERKNRDNYPFLDEKSQSAPVYGGASKNGFNKAKEAVYKHAGVVMSKVMDSPQFEQVQKAIFEKADDVSSVLSNLTKTSQMTEKVAKIVFEKANETMSKVFAMQINETGIPRQWVCELRELADTSALGEGASSVRHLETLHCLPEYLKYLFEGATGDEKPRELISESKQINELLQRNMQDVEPVLDVFPSQIKIPQPEENFQNLAISEETLQCNDTANKCVSDNYSLWGTDREEISRPELNISRDVNNMKESLTQEESDSLLSYRHIKSDFVVEQSSIVSEGDLETSPKFTATIISSLQNIPNETDLLSKSVGKGDRKKMNRRFISVAGNISKQYPLDKSGDNNKKSKRSVTGLDRYDTKRKKRSVNKRRFVSGKSLDVASGTEDEAHKTKKEIASNSGRTRTFDWKYMKF